MFLLVKMRNQRTRWCFKMVSQENLAPLKQKYLKSKQDRQNKIAKTYVNFMVFLFKLFPKTKVEKHFLKLNCKKLYFIFKILRSTRENLLVQTGSKIMHAKRYLFKDL